MLSKGCVAILDALGFGRIYQHIEPQRVLDAMLFAKEKTVEMYRIYRITSERDKRYFGSLGLGVLHHEMYKTRIQFVSDTVIIASCYNDPTLASDPGHFEPSTLHTIESPSALISQTLQIVVDLVSYFLGEAALASVPLAYRGSISVGELDIRDGSDFENVSGGFIIGPAVDEAAKYHQSWEGAFVTLDAEAEAVLTFIKEFAKEHGFQCPRLPVLLREEVPVKAVGAEPQSSTRHCVVPHALIHQEYRVDVVGNLLRTFERPVPPDLEESVRRKRQNTEQFLRRCEQLCDGQVA